MITALIISAAVISLLIIYIFLISPRLGHKQKYKLSDSGYAHRGLWNDTIPENSLPAFCAAVQNGFGIETDVRLTKDNIPVLFHDDDLRRMCGIDKRIDACTYDELTLYRLRGVEKIPTLAELLQAVDGRVPLLIELKGVTLDSALCDIIAPMLDKYNGQFTVESFNPLLLRKMKKLRPNIARGLLITSAFQPAAKEHRLRNAIVGEMLFNFLARPDFIAYDNNYKNDAALFIVTRIMKARRCVWTIRDKETYSESIQKKDCPIFEGFIP